MGSIGQVSCGKTVGKWPRKANTQTGNERFHVISPIFTGKTMREFRFDLSLPPPLSLSISLSLDFVRFERKKERGGGKERKIQTKQETRSRMFEFTLRRFFAIDDATMVPSRGWQSIEKPF